MSVNELEEKVGLILDPVAVGIARDGFHAEVKGGVHVDRLERLAIHTGAAVVVELDPGRIFALVVEFPDSIRKQGVFDAVGGLIEQTAGPGGLDRG